MRVSEVPDGNVESLHLFVPRVLAQYRRAGRTGASLQDYGEPYRRLVKEPPPILAEGERFVKTLILHSDLYCLDFRSHRHRSLRSSHPNFLSLHSARPTCSPVMKAFEYYSFSV